MSFAGGNAERKPDIGELKNLIAEQAPGALREPHQLKRAEGIPTGLQVLDRYLFWNGLPKGSLTLFSGALGSGATSLWIEAASRSLALGRWTAWIDGETPLSPLSLQHRGLDLKRFIAIQAQPNPAAPSIIEEKKLFWLLQELMASSLFEIIGCDLGNLRLKEHQLRKLQAQARTSSVALVFLSRLKPFRGSAASVFGLIVSFEKRRVVIERALHRPAPHSFSRSVSYARFTLHTADRIGLGPSSFASSDGSSFEPRALSKA